MKSVIHKLLIKVGSPFNINIGPFLIKNHFPRSSRGIATGEGLFKKDSKSKYHIGRENTLYEALQKVTFGEYCYLSIPIVAFILGTWQIQRHQWKLDLIEKLKTRTNQEPLELLSILDDMESKEYYPIKARGQFLYDREFTIGYRGLIVDGKPAKSQRAVDNHEMQRGYHVITPFKLADQDLTILVNRGWVPKQHRNPTHRQDSQIEGETEIVGILRLNEKRPPFVPKNNPQSDILHYRDVNAMAEKAGATPIYLEMVSNNYGQQYPIAGQTRVELRNEHLNYILTWYCLSAATAYIWFKKFVRGIPLAY